MTKRYFVVKTVMREKHALPQLLAQLQYCHSSSLPERQARSSLRPKLPPPHSSQLPPPHSSHIPPPDIISSASQYRSVKRNEEGRLAAGPKGLKGLHQERFTSSSLCL
eukprot:GHVN01038968.1.p2 GENE.GHVN01038968.1~~GHVN01038968.1.p2  ORF type:complete len:108 (-),score=36.04 GHVN01038968.1:432-755(-)